MNNTAKNTKSHQIHYLIALGKNGGDDRIRTCGSLLDYNDLANRRFQPLSHVSKISTQQLRNRKFHAKQGFILA